MENTSAISIEHYQFLQRVFEAGYCYAGENASEGLDAFLKKELGSAVKMVDFIEAVTPGLCANKINGSDIKVSPSRVRSTY